jgi:FkbM family methyltransferase
MRDDVREWAGPTIEVLKRHLDAEPKVETPQELAKAVEKGISQVTLDQRANVWSGMLGKQVLYPHPSGVSYWIRLGDGISMNVIRSDRDDSATQFVLSHLTKGGTFFDVGANTGWFALRAAARYRELGAGMVHAFEPQPVMFDLVTRSIEENGLQDMVELHGIALGNEESTVWMTTPAFNSGGSLVRFKEVKDSAEVPLKRFDSLGLAPDKVDIMKVDIEGSEPFFVEGAVEFIKRYRPVIYSELHPKKLQWVANRSREDYLDQMEALGYRTLALGPAGKAIAFDRAELQTNARLLDVVFQPE